MFQELAEHSCVSSTTLSVEPQACTCHKAYIHPSVIASPLMKVLTPHDLSDHIKGSLECL